MAGAGWLIAEGTAVFGSTLGSVLSVVCKRLPQLWQKSEDARLIVLQTEQTDNRCPHSPQKDWAR
jgi:hypothetical protein